MGKVNVNDKTSLAFIRKKIITLTVDNECRHKYMDAADAILRELFDKKNIASKIVHTSGYRDMGKIISSIDSAALFEILRKAKNYKNLAILIKIEYDISRDKCGKKNRKKLEKLRAEGIKAFCDSYNIRRAGCNDYESLKSFVKSSKRRYRDDDEDWDIFDFDDDFDDDYYDDFDDSDDDFDTFVKTSKRRRFKEDDDDDDNEDVEESKLDKLCGLVERMLEDKAAEPTPIPRKSPTTAFDLAKMVSTIDQKFEQQYEINEKLVDMMNTTRDRLDEMEDVIVNYLGDDSNEATEETTENVVDPFDDDSVEMEKTTTTVEVTEETTKNKGQIYRQKR